MTKTINLKLIRANLREWQRKDAQAKRKGRKQSCLLSMNWIPQESTVLMKQQANATGTVLRIMPTAMLLQRATGHLLTSANLRWIPQVKQVATAVSGAGSSCDPPVRTVGSV